MVTLTWRCVDCNLFGFIPVLDGPLRLDDIRSTIVIHHGRHILTGIPEDSRLSDVVSIAVAANAGTFRAARGKLIIETELGSQFGDFEVRHVR